MQLVKILSSEIDNLKRRVVKFLRFGLSDVRTSLEAAPFGVDGSPLKDFIAVYSDTSEAGKSVLVGYINKNQLAEPGELRLYSLDSEGNQKFEIYLKKTGVCAINGESLEVFGNSDNLVKWTPLNSALNQEAAIIDQNLTLIAANLTQLNAAINALVPGSVTTPYAKTTVSVDIENAKNTKIKCN